MQNFHSEEVSQCLVYLRYIEEISFLWLGHRAPKQRPQLQYNTTQHESLYLWLNLLDNKSNYVLYSNY